MSFQINPFTGQQDSGTGDTGYEVTGVPGTSLHRRYVFPPDTAQTNRRPNDPGWGISTGYLGFTGENGTTRFVDPVIAIGYNPHTFVGNKESTVHGWAYVLEADYYLAGGDETYDAQSCEAYVAYTRRQTTFDGASAPHKQQRIFQWNVYSSESRNYNITGVSIGSPCVITLSFGTTDMSPAMGQKILISGITGTGAVSSLNGTRQKIIDISPQTATSTNVTIEYDTTGGTYTASTGTAAIDWEGTIGSTTLRGDNVIYACGNVHDNLIAHTLFGRNYFYGYQVDNRRYYRMSLGSQSSGAGITRGGGVLFNMYQAGQNAASNAAGSGYFQLSTMEILSGANNPTGSGVCARIELSGAQGASIYYNAYSFPANSPIFVFGRDDANMGGEPANPNGSSSSLSAYGRMYICGGDLPAANRTMSVRAGRNSTGDIALFGSQNNSGGKNYFRIGNNAELILRNPPATPSNPNANEVSLYFNGTNLVYRDSAGTVKTITAT